MGMGRTNQRPGAPPGLSQMSGNLGGGAPSQWLGALPQMSGLGGGAPPAQNWSPASLAPPAQNWSPASLAPLPQQIGMGAQGVQGAQGMDIGYQDFLRQQTAPPQQMPVWGRQSGTPWQPRFQQGGPVAAPRWSPAQAAAWGAQQTAPPPIGSPIRNTPPPGGAPIPSMPWGQKGYPHRVSGREAPGDIRNWRNQQWTLGGAGPNQWSDRFGRGWGRNNGGLTSLYWPGGRVY